MAVGGRDRIKWVVTEHGAMTDWPEQVWTMGRVSGLLAGVEQWTGRAEIGV